MAPAAIEVTLSVPCAFSTLLCHHNLATCNCSYFKVSARGSTISNEIKSGVVTFLTMSYILLVNPQILGAAGAHSTAIQ
jgi:hypothetical protein